MIQTPSFKIVEGDSPIITASIHDGHELRPELEPFMALSEADRLREEDSFTSQWAELGRTQIYGRKTRFEVDFNRPREKAVYQKPEDAWGLNVWKKELPEGVVKRSLAEYDAFYAAVKKVLDTTQERYGSFVVYDIHSYNHRRNGPDAEPADPRENPEVNVGTSNMSRELWSPVVDDFMETMREFDFQGRSLDVRENVKFRGGYFARWIHDNYPDTSCVLAIEFKKIFEDEWTGESYPEIINLLRDALQNTLPVVLEKRLEVQDRLVAMNYE